MITQAKRDRVAAKIRELLATEDRSKLPAHVAYERLYPDEVDFGLFHAVWQHVLSGAPDPEPPSEAPAAGTASASSEASIVDSGANQSVAPGPETAETLTAMPGELPG